MSKEVKGPLVSKINVILSGAKNLEISEESWGGHGPPNSRFRFRRALQFIFSFQKGYPHDQAKV
jgi:hypothetical protein